MRRDAGGGQPLAFLDARLPTHPSQRSPNGATRSLGRRGAGFPMGRLGLLARL